MAFFPRAIFSATAFGGRPGPPGPTSRAPCDDGADRSSSSAWCRRRPRAATGSRSRPPAAPCRGSPSPSSSASASFLPSAMGPSLVIQPRTASARIAQTRGRFKESELGPAATEPGIARGAPTKPRRRSWKRWQGRRVRRAAWRAQSADFGLPCSPPGLGGSEGELLDANPPAEPFGAPASTRLGSGLARWGTRDELVREEKRYRFSEARMEPSTFDTHNGDASRRGASLPRRTWPTSDPVSGRSGCGSGWLIKSRRKPSNSSEERASGKYLELLETEEPPAGVEPATY